MPKILRRYIISKPDTVFTHEENKTFSVHLPGEYFKNKWLAMTLSNGLCCSNVFT